jgi:hypothetical protein
MTSNNLVNSFAGRVQACATFAEDCQNDERRIVKSFEDWHDLRNAALDDEVES